MAEGMSIVEVAKVAGVSTATVSRVMNGQPGVRPETVAQVRAVMLQLNYTRLRTRSPRKRNSTRSAKLRTGSIAVITIGHGQNWLMQPIMASVLRGIQRGVTTNELRLILGEMSSPSKPSQLLVDRQIDGAIVFLSSDVPIAMYEATFAAMQRYAPVVWAMGIGTALGGVDHVAPDNIGIGHLAYSYLRGLDCKRPAFLTMNPNWALMRLRGQSFLNSAFDDGRPPTVYAVADDPKHVAPYSGRIVSAPSLPELIKAFAEDSSRADGLFIGNDSTTSQVYPLLAQQAIAIGSELRVVSCDAEDARLAGLHPRPASIDIGAEEIGYRCVNRLLNRIERPHGPPLIIQVTPRLDSLPAV
jgi:DNA-binding LacI/PurR family transcriptional regulator